MAAQGHVRAQSIQAIYVVVKRTNHLREGLDVSHAKVAPEALEQLRACSESTVCRPSPIRFSQRVGSALWRLPLRWPTLEGLDGGEAAKAVRRLTALAAARPLVPVARPPARVAGRAAGAPFLAMVYEAWSCLGKSVVEASTGNPASFHSG